MDERILLEIKNGMAESLTPEQMGILDGTLRRVLGRYEAVAREGGAEDERLDGPRYMELFLSAKRTEGCSKRTVDYYRSVLEAFRKGVGRDMRLVSTDAAREFFHGYQAARGCSPTTLDNMRRVLSSFYNWMESEDHVLKSPVRRIHKIRTPQVIREPFTDENIETMRSHLRGDPRDAAIFEFLLSSGIRVGELVKLNRDSLNMAERSCVVYGKGAKEREVYFDAKAKHALEDYLGRRKDGNPALFVSRKASAATGKRERISINAVETMVRRMGRSPGIENAHPHRFRRTMATRALDKGMAIELVQFLLGHTKIDTTLRYAMVRQNNVRAAHRKYMC